MSDIETTTYWLRAPWIVTGLLSAFSYAAYAVLEVRILDISIQLILHLSQSLAR